MSLKNSPSFLLNFSDTEMNGRNTQYYSFKSFRLEVSERQLIKNGVPVPLTPKAFDVIALLVKNAGHLVEKEELMKAVWPDSFVEEASVSRIIHTIRKVLGDDQANNKFIETVAKKGYRFVAEVNEVYEPAAKWSAIPGSLVGAELPPAYEGGSDVHDETAYSAIAKPKQKSRIVLFTVGFASAITLIFLLSFNFQSAYSVKSNKGKSTSHARYRRNDEAYRLCLLGTVLAYKLTPDSAQKAIDDFERALALDPDYAPAYAGLANVHTSLAFMGENTSEEYNKARTAIDKAFAIDDDLAEAHSYFGEMKTNFEWNYVDAEREHKLAIELDPTSAAAHRMYALLLAFLGRSDESIAEIKTAIDLEPALPVNHFIYQQNAFYARHYDESIAEGKRTLEMDPDFPRVPDTLVACHLKKGDDDEAFKWFLVQHKKDKPEEIETWKTIYARSRWMGIFERQLEQAKENEKNGHPNPLTLANLYTKTGDAEQAFIYLNKAFDAHMQGLTSLKVTPNYDLLRTDPRFDNLLKRVGFK